jgi:hypothetical protein
MAKPKYQDPNGRHIRVYGELLNSPAYRVMSFAAKALFIDMRERVTGTNNGNISAALTDMKHKGWSSAATLSKALYELRTMGFIAVTRMGGLKIGTRVCTLYRFTDLEVFDQPKVGVQAIKATHDYRAFKSVGEAQQALRTGVESLKEEGAKKQIPRKKPPVQKLNCIGSKSELGDGLSVQNMNRGI